VPSMIHSSRRAGHWGPDGSVAEQRVIRLRHTHKEPSSDVEAPGFEGVHCWSMEGPGATCG
jgi:hypothetical protein